MYSSANWEVIIAYSAWPHDTFKKIGPQGGMESSVIT